MKSGDDGEEAQNRRWDEERLEHLKDRENFARMLRKLEHRIDEGATRAVAALKEVTAELRALRRRPGAGPNGNGRRR
jgi:hypothetical protein